MNNQMENVKAAVVVSELDPEVKQQGIARRAAQKIRGLSHHAYYCTDVEKTRHFYEEVLEMRLTMSLRIPEEVFTGEPKPYCHLFFEMGDGSSIAFFDYPAFFDHEPPFVIPTVYHHHIAIHVDSDESIEYYRKRILAAGYQCEYVDHGDVFHSLYVRDPNGMHLELTHVPSHAEQFFLQAEATAHTALASWGKTRC
jgi:catechol 2,3-dioxygenase-like lactoylglutathione lyase family enzyme